MKEPLERAANALTDMRGHASSATLVPHRLLKILEARDDRGGAEKWRLDARTDGSRGDAPNPRVQRVEMAAVYFADISGFSKLENDFEVANQGGPTVSERGGMDRFSSLLNATLGGVEAIVSNLGGCVVHLAGDALICVFLGAADAAADDAHRLMETAEEAARQTIGVFETVFKKLEPRLAIHGAVAWGRLDFLYLDSRGDAFGQVRERDASRREAHSRQVTLCGEALSLCLDLAARSKRGEILLYRGPMLDPEAVDASNASDARFCIDVGEEKLDVVDKNESRESLARVETRAGTETRLDETFDDETPSDETSRWLLYVPDFFRARAFSVGDALMASRMHVTTVFVHLCGFRVDGVGLDVVRLNGAYAAACRETRALGGHVDTLLCDDKGFVFKSLFGLAGESVHDSELRGVMCATRLLDLFQKESPRITAKIGVASGEAFVGAMRGGSGTYVGFTMLSSSGVTLAARLMGAADENQALCSASVRAATRDSVEYRGGAREFALKGIQAPAAAFVPNGDVHLYESSRRIFPSRSTAKNDTLETTDQNKQPSFEDDSTNETRGDGATSGTVSETFKTSVRRAARDVSVSVDADGVSDAAIRRNVRDALDAATARLSSSPSYGGIVSISGDAGMGKSVAFRYAASLCLDVFENVRAVVIRRNSVHVDDPACVGRALLSRLVGVLGGVAAAATTLALTPTDVSVLALWDPARRDEAARWLEEAAAFRGRDENEESGDFPKHQSVLVPIPAHERVAALVALVTRLVAAVGRVALLVDDAHWLDECSWETMRALARNEGSRDAFLAVVCHRPTFGARTTEVAFEKCVASASTNDVRAGHKPSRDGPSERGSYVLRFTLAPLTDAEATLLVETVANGALDAKETRSVVRQSRGHPLFVVELARRRASQNAAGQLRAETSSGSLGSNSSLSLEFKSRFVLETRGAPPREDDAISDSETRAGFGEDEKDALLRSTKTTRRIMQTALLDLTPHQLELIAYAACLGSQFDSEFLTRIVREAADEGRSSYENTSSFEDTLAVVAGHLAEFVKRRLLECVGDCTLDAAAGSGRTGRSGSLSLEADPASALFLRMVSDPSGVRKYVFRFRNQLMQDTVYNTMLTAQRESIHAFIARRLERRLAEKDKDSHRRTRIDPPQKTQVARARLAGQWRLAGRPDRAWRHYRAAAEAAVSVGVLHDAISLFTNAVDAAEASREAALEDESARASAVSDADVGHLHARMSFLFTEMTFNFDLAVRSAALGLERFGVALPKRLTASMVVKELALLHAGLSGATDAGFKNKSASEIERNGETARAVVRCYSSLTYAVTGSMLNALSVEALQTFFPGWDEKNARAWLTLKTANVAERLAPGSPEYVAAMTSAAVVGFFGMRRTRALACARAERAITAWHVEARRFRSRPSRREEDAPRAEATNEKADDRGGDFSERYLLWDDSDDASRDDPSAARRLAQLRASASANFGLFSGVWAATSGNPRIGLRRLSATQRAARASAASVTEMLATQFIVGLYVFVDRDEPERARSALARLRQLSERGAGFAAFMARTWVVLFDVESHVSGSRGEGLHDVLTFLSESHRLPHSRMFSLVAMTNDVIRFALGNHQAANGYAAGEYANGEVSGEERVTKRAYAAPRKETAEETARLRKTLRTFFEHARSYETDDFLPWSLGYSVGIPLAIAALCLMFVASTGRDVVDARLASELVRRLAPVWKKGAVAQPLLRLPYALFAALAFEALDHEAFLFSKKGKRHVKALEIAFSRATSANTPEYAAFAASAEFHVARWRGDFRNAAKTVDGAVFLGDALAAAPPGFGMHLLALSHGYLPGNPARIERFEVIAAKSDAGGERRATRGCMF